MLIPAAATADLDGRPSILGRRVVVRLGELSFSFYMVHILVARATEFFIPHRPHFAPGKAALVAVVLFGLSLALSWVLYEWVENPGKRLILGIGRRRRRSARRFPTGCRSALPPRCLTRPDIDPASTGPVGHVGAGPV